MQEDRTESVTSLLFFHFFPTTTPLTQKTRPRWWIKRKIRAANEGRPEWNCGPCWGLAESSPSPRVRWGPARRGPRQARLPRKARTLTFSQRPAAGRRHLKPLSTTWTASGRARAPEPDVSGPRPARAPETPSCAVPAPAPP